MENKSLLIKQFKEKIKEIKKHNNLYYNFDKPKISDSDYDKLKKKLPKSVMPAYDGMKLLIN